MFHFRLSSNEAPSTEEDTKLKKATVELEQLQELQNNEGKTPEMSSATRLVSPRQGGILEGELGPYIPAFPVKDLAAGMIVGEARPSMVANSALNGSSGQSRDRMAESARTMGEVHFGSAEAIDGWKAPFPVLEVAVELTDESTAPHSNCQLERNQSDSTDREMNLASAELMETAEIKEVCPLVDCQLDTAEDYLHQTTGNIPAQATGSSEARTAGNIPGQSTGSFETQETGSPETQTAEKSEVATTASSVERASSHVVVYPNSGSVSPSIIIENNNQQLPVMNLDATEEPGSLERGSHGTTVTTGVAGTEQRTRTGHWYNQIPRTRGTSFRRIRRDLSEV